MTTLAIIIFVAAVWAIERYLGGAFRSDRPWSAFKRN